MAVTKISDVVTPEQFTAYVVENSVVKTALVQSGVARVNGVIKSQLQAGSDSFTVPHWNDLNNDEADIVSDDPSVDAVPRALTADKQVVRKSYLHAGWSAMNLASELSGDDPISSVRDRVTQYWSRQTQGRLVASLQGILANNVANNSSDMVHDISTKSGNAAEFSAAAVIEAASTLGDSMLDLSGIAMHSDTYTEALKNDLIATVQDSDGDWFQTFRGLAVIVDDGLPVSSGVYTTVLFGSGAVGYGVTQPRIADGTEIEEKPSAGNGGGQQILHSRVNLAVHPSGFTWTEGNVSADSPSVTELTDKANWKRVFQRQNVPLAFLKHK